MSCRECFFDIIGISWFVVGTRGVGLISAVFNIISVSRILFVFVEFALFPLLFGFCSSCVRIFSV